jgi:Uma2 family endonuclease
MTHDHDIKASPVTDEELERMSSEHSGWRFERVNGELLVKAPVRKYSAYLESRFFLYVAKWAEKHNAEVYGAQAGFKLPNGNIRSPDVSVILPSHPQHGRKSDEFIAGAPDFLIEIRSESDPLHLLQEKMREWIDQGCRLALLIDPQQKKVSVYHSDGTVREYPYDATISGEDVLPGFLVCPAEIDR